MLDTRSDHVLWSSSYLSLGSITSESESECWLLDSSFEYDCVQLFCTDAMLQRPWHPGSLDFIYSSHNLVITGHTLRLGLVLDGMHNCKDTSVRWHASFFGGVQNCSFYQSLLSYTVAYASRRREWSVCLMCGVCWSRMR